MRMGKADENEERSQGGRRVKGSVPERQNKKESVLLSLLII